MCMRNVMMMGLITVLSVGILWSSEAADQHDRMYGYGLGQPATDLDIQHWNIDVAPTGEGLPPAAGRPNKVPRSLPPSVRPAMDRRVRKARWTAWWEAPAH